MNKSFLDMDAFEEWFRSKLVEEKQRRINYILLKWDTLDRDDRESLIDFIDNTFLKDYKQLFINKKYNDFYLILKDQFELSYELIHKWSSSK